MRKVRRHIIDADTASIRAVLVVCLAKQRLHSRGQKSIPGKGSKQPIKSTRSTPTLKVEEKCRVKVKCVMKCPLEAIA